MKKSESLGPAHIQEESMTQRCEYGEYWGPSERLASVVYIQLCNLSFSLNNALWILPHVNINIYALSS